MRHDPIAGDQNPQADGGATWEEIANDGDMRVRRFHVPGGWLYQVEHHQRVSPTSNEPDSWIFGWHPPVFVPVPR